MKKKKQNIVERIKKERKKKKGLKIQSRISMYTRISRYLYIFIESTRLPPQSKEIRKRERQRREIEEVKYRWKNQKRKEEKKKKVWKFSHEFSRTLEFGRYLYIFIEPTRLPLYTAGRQVKQRETGNGGSFRLCGTYRKFTMPRWLRQRHHHDTFDCCHPPHWYRACVPIWTWKINLLPLPIGAPPSSPRTRARVCIYMYLSSDNPHSPNTSSHDNEGFREKLMLRKHYIYIYV